MVGKIVRQRRLHQPAPKPTEPQQSGGEKVLSAAALTCSADTEKGKSVLTSNIFSGVNIDPKILVKKLDTDSRNPVSVVKDGDEKVLMSKKEKMKLRKERWLQKIEGIKIAKQQQKAEAKRKAIPVVGDMHPLMDALPELSDLVTVRKFCKQRNKMQKKKKVLTNFNRMKSAQKRKVLEEEVAHFHKTTSNPLFKANPLSLISEHLSKRLKQEEEEEPL
ncbi:ribosome biogenesis protein SLX9 homolog [Candoia aspera]|uniref:ribosome biogenesis protein SLX9 homolog n=1 Tax=Candoia aspera TaxID=51853 RepID=UPI002FD80CA3